MVSSKAYPKLKQEKYVSIFEVCSGYPGVGGTRRLGDHAWTILHDDFLYNMVLGS